MEMNKIEWNNLYQCLGGYYFQVIVSYNSEPCGSFYADGVKVFQKNIHNIAFTQTFADDILPDSFVTHIMKNSTEITIICGEIQYMIPIKSMRKKQNPNVMALPDRITIDTFMDEKYIDKEKVHVAFDEIFVPVDIGLLRNCTRKEKVQIIRILEDILNGKQQSMQYCRLIGFSIRFVGEGYIIFAHIYDIIHSTYNNRIELFNSEDDLNNIQPYTKFVNFLRCFR